MTSSLHHANPKRDIFGRPFHPQVSLPKLLYLRRYGGWGPQSAPAPENRKKAWSR